MAAKSRRGSQELDRPGPDAGGQRCLSTLTHLGLAQLGNLHIPNLTANNVLPLYSPEGKGLSLEKPSEGSTAPNFY